MVRLEHVTKYYGKHCALNDVGFSVREPMTLGILGRNGAGKTTLLKSMAGCLRPDQGEVSIGGHSFRTEPLLARSLISFLPENAPLYPEMLVEDYLRFVCRLRKVPEKEVALQIKNAAESTGIQEVLERKIGNLSKGYRQRVGLAQVLCGNADVLILDEPMTGLDPLEIIELRGLIRTLSKKKIVVLSSHLLAEIEAVSDRVLILNQGKLAADKKLTETFTHIQLEAVADAQSSVLLPALRALKTFKEVHALPYGDAQKTRVLLTAREEVQDPEKQLFDFLCAVHIPLLRLLRAEDSLEAVFLRACGEETEQDQQ